MIQELLVMLTTPDFFFNSRNYYFYKMNLNDKGDSLLWDKVFRVIGFNLRVLIIEIEFLITFKNEGKGLL